jgi:hypothetical protein
MDRYIKKGIKRDKKWIDEQAQRAEATERWGDTKLLYDITRTLSGRRFRKNKPIKGVRGELVTQEQQLKRWEEYFSRIFNKDKRHRVLKKREKKMKIQMEI